MKSASEKEIFETMPVPMAVMTLAVPTIISQIVTMVYNLADTFFVGQIGDPLMVAAVSLVYPWFHILSAFGNLFGVGGGSLISRLLGAKRGSEARCVSSFSFFGALTVSLAYALLSLVFMEPILKLLGASSATAGYARSYLLWVIVIGGVPTVLGLTLGNLLRSEGHAREASLGMMLGGLLNVALDPLFIFTFRMNVTGAALATAVSNAVSVLFFLGVFRRLRGRTQMSLRFKYFVCRYAREVLSVGSASAIAVTLGALCNMTIVKLASAYGDVPVAAYGIVKKVDLFPMAVSMGLCQGFMPLVGYNYAAKNYRRMNAISRFSWAVGGVFSAVIVASYWFLSPQIMHFFIHSVQTERIGASFLRVACLAIPVQVVNFLISYSLQAMGKGMQALVLFSCRLGFFNIPLLFVMNSLIGMYGMVWVQLMAETLVIPVSFLLYILELRKLKREERSDSA